MKKVLSMFVALVLVFSFTACSAPVLQQLQLPTETVDLEVGQTFGIKTDAVFDKELDAARLEKLMSELLPTLTYESDNMEVATVDETGLVTAVAPGKATVTVAAGEIRAAIAVVVIQKAVSVEFAEKEVTISAGAKLELVTKVMPEKATYTLTYTSKDTKIAAVDKKGVVTAVAAGETLIMVETDNGLKSEVKVIVTAAEPESVSSSSAASQKPTASSSSNRNTSSSTSNSTSSPTSKPPATTSSSPASKPPTPSSQTTTSQAPVSQAPVSQTPASKPPTPSSKPPVATLNAQEAVNAAIAYANGLPYVYGVNQAMPSYNFGLDVAMHAANGGDQASLNAHACQQVDMAHAALMQDVNKLLEMGAAPEEIPVNPIGVWIDNGVIYAGWGG